MSEVKNLFRCVPPSMIRPTKRGESLLWDLSEEEMETLSVLLSQCPVLYRDGKEFWYSTFSKFRISEDGKTLYYSEHQRNTGKRPTVGIKLQDCGVRIAVVWARPGVSLSARYLRELLRFLGKAGRRHNLDSIVLMDSVLSYTHVFSMDEDGHLKSKQITEEELHTMGVTKASLEGFKSKERYMVGDVFNIARATDCL